MARITPETVSKIIDSADIVDVVGRYVELKRRGANYVGLCPFHNDRSPSFYVSRSKGIYKCFSCGKAGKVVSFVMEHENVSYPEALKILAAMYGIEVAERELTDDERLREQRRDSILAVISAADDFFRNNLSADPQALDMLADLSLSADATATFGIGLASRNGSALLNHLKSKGFDPQIIAKAALCDDHAETDTLRNCLTLPVRTKSGRLIGFAGLRLTGFDKTSTHPYANELFNPTEELFGLYQARREISSLNQAIVTHDPIAMIALWLSDIRNVVATPVAEVTSEQARLLVSVAAPKGETGRITLVNPASAGEIERLLAIGASVRIATIGQSPLNMRASQLKTAVETSVDAIVHVINEAIATDRNIDRAAHCIACIPSAIARDVYAGELASAFAISHDEAALRIRKVTQFKP